MTEVINTKRNTIRIYGCGGAGVFNTTPFARNSLNNESNFAIFDPAYIDTSDSDMSLTVPDNNKYLFADMDGSGKKRGMNAAPIASYCPDILHQFKPSNNLNVVVHSAGGGSGSVIGPVIVEQLLKMNKKVVVIMIGSSSSAIDTKNTINTISSYDNYSRDIGRPAVMYYLENSAKVNMATVDSHVQGMIVMLSLLFSGNNRKLDSADLENLLNYPAVSNFPSQLAYCGLADGGNTLSSVNNAKLVAMASLLAEGENMDADMNVNYHVHGFMSTSAKSTTSSKTPIHFGIYLGYFTKVVANLKAKLAEMDAQDRLFKDTPIGTGGGLVL